jgi:hypothetical protein
VHRPYHARAPDDLAGVLLPVSVGLCLLPRGADQRLARAPFALGTPKERGLAARGSAGFGRAGVRLLLGAVELLLLPEVDLHHARGGLFARLRDAAFGLRGLPALRAGALRADVPYCTAPTALATVRCPYLHLLTPSLPFPGTPLVGEGVLAAGTALTWRRRARRDWCHRALRPTWVP